MVLLHLVRDDLSFNRAVAGLGCCGLFPHLFFLNGLKSLMTETIKEEILQIIFDLIIHMATSHIQGKISSF